MDLKTEFDIAIRNSIKLKDEDCLNKKRDDKKYYDDQYAKPIKEFFDKQGIVSYEVNYSKRYKCTSICAFASSGRLCYLYFRPMGATFEKELFNDLENSRPTKMDAVLGITNYECKCQEIISKSHTPLKARYLESKLFSGGFGIKNYEIVPKEFTDKETDEKKIEQVLCFNVGELNIKLPNNPDYAHLHFDLKQLICHLLAIANESKGDKANLQYVFFKPSEKEIRNSKKVTKLYKELNEEIEAIFAPTTKISVFAKEHKIKILEPLFVRINEIVDFNYQIAFKK